MAKTNKNYLRRILRLNSTLIEPQSDMGANVNFRFMTYNVLAQSKIHRELLYHYCSKIALKKSFRHLNLINEINAISPDLFCLQEVCYMEDIWEKNFSPNFNSHFHLCNPGNSDHGLALFCNKNKFEIKEVKVIRFEDLADEYDDPETKREFGSHQIATITTLKILGHDGPTEKRLIVVNTHLFWNPFYNFVRLRQMDRILVELGKIKSGDKNSPILFGGDLNFTPQSILYNVVFERAEMNKIDFFEFLTHPIHARYKTIGIKELNEYTSNFEESDQKNLQKLKEDSYQSLKPGDIKRIDEAKEIVKRINGNITLKSLFGCYKDIERNNTKPPIFCKENEPDFTNYTLNFKETIDYVSVENSENSRLRCVGLMELPNVKEMGKQVALPNDSFGSDHVCLAADFEFV